MERLIIYGLVLLNLCIGLLLYYRKPRPFGRRSYEAYLQAEPESLKAAGADAGLTAAEAEAPLQSKFGGARPGSRQSGGRRRG